MRKHNPIIFTAIIGGRGKSGKFESKNQKILE